MNYPLHSNRSFAMVFVGGLMVLAQGIAMFLSEIDTLTAGNCLLN